MNGNPTGGGESHLYIKPNFNVLGQQFGQAAPPQESKNNVQVSYGDGKPTATEQLKVAFPFIRETVLVIPMVRAGFARKQNKCAIESVA